MKATFLTLAPGDTIEIVEDRIASTQGVVDVRLVKVIQGEPLLPNVNDAFYVKKEETV